MKYRILKPREVLKPGDQYFHKGKWYNTINAGKTVAQARHPFCGSKYRRAVKGVGK